MRELLVLALKGVAGGTFVVVFAALAETLRPKSLSGILAAAPSVALASLLVSLVARGEHEVWRLALGMLAGAAALTVCCLAGIEAVRRGRARPGALAVVAVWLAVAGAIYGTALR